MNKLTAKYIDDHRNSIHTYDSFGRALADLILQSAKQQLEKAAGDSSEVNYKADVKVYSISPQGCVGVQVCVPFGGCSTVHVNVQG